MFDVVLVHPEIPPNTGNVIRLCANTGARLHLVQPLGFSLHDKQLARAGLDYHDLVRVTVHPDWEACRATFGADRRLMALSARGTTRYSDAGFQASDVLVFGPESAGLAPALLDTFPDGQRLRLPMTSARRSLNLSNAVAVVVYEAWRQLGFPGGL